MSKRTAKFVSAIFAGLLATTPFTTISHGAPEAADKCLSGPKGAPPQGMHWYYRIDRAARRNCWYIGDEKEKVSRAAPDNSQQEDDSVSPPVSRPVSQPVPLPKSAGTQRSIANARAELPLPQTRVEPDPGAFAGPRSLAAAVAARPENSQRMNSGDIDAQQSVVASRWPELAGVSSVAVAVPPAANPQIIAQLNSNVPPPAADAAATTAAADASLARPPGSIQQLLIAIVGALSLAGLIASAIFRLGSATRRKARFDRRVNWDSARTDRPSLSEEARGTEWMREAGRLPEGRHPRVPRVLDEPNDRTTQMLARLARSAAN